jgi:hypothetical protein
MSREERKPGVASPPAPASEMTAVTVGPPAIAAALLFTSRRKAAR